jgi:hypothetical protein
MTDIPAANGAAIRSILVEPLDPAREPWVTRWNRFFEKKKRRQLIKGEGKVPSLEGESMSQMNVVRRCYNCGAILQSEKPGD